MTEKSLVNKLTKFLKSCNYEVAVEVANFYRSADIAVIDNNKKVWVIECKISSLKQAVRQLQVHKLAADKLYIATVKKNIRNETKQMLKKSGIGLIFILPDDTIEFNSEFNSTNVPWEPAKIRLQNRILGTAEI